MKRRLVIKQVLIMAGGLALLPSCLKETGRSTILLKKISIDLDQENLLAEIAETIIPKTDTPGARELKLHLFVLKMLDDCYEEKDQQQFIKGLGQLKDKVYDRYAKSFNKLSVIQRQDILTTLGKEKEVSPELFRFYQIMKDRTIDGYLNSKYVMTSLIIYELVPGRYNGYFPVKSA
jgi:hypothetical protein